VKTTSYNIVHYLLGLHDSSKVSASANVSVCGTSRRRREDVTSVMGYDQTNDLGMVC